MSFLCSVRYDNFELILGKHGLTELLKKNFDRSVFNEFTRLFKNTNQTNKIMLITPQCKLIERNKKLEKIFWFGEYLILATNNLPNYWVHLEVNDSWKVHFLTNAKNLEFKDFEAGNY